jgi:hypothetical protein
MNIVIDIDDNNSSDDNRVMSCYQHISVSSHDELSEVILSDASVLPSLDSLKALDDRENKSNKHSLITVYLICVGFVISVVYFNHFR